MATVAVVLFGFLFSCHSEVTFACCLHGQKVEEFFSEIFSWSCEGCLGDTILWQVGETAWLC